MGHYDHQPAAIAASKLAGKALELLRVGDNGADYHDGVPQYGHILNYYCPLNISKCLFLLILLLDKPPS